MQKVIHILFILSFVFVQPLAAQDMPIGLEDLFKIADDNNRSLKIASYNEQLAQKEIETAKNKLLPSLDAMLAVSYYGNGLLLDRDFSNVMSLPFPPFENNFALEATQIIYSGGAIKNSIKVSELNLLLAQLDKQKNQQDIRFLISGYYLELLKLKNQKEILQHNIEQTEKLLQQIKNKIVQGAALKNSATRYEVQKQSLELTLIKISNAEKIINNELVKTLQMPVGMELKIKTNIDPSLTSAQYTSSEWQDLAKTKAPVLQQTQLQIQQAKYQQILARSEKLPQIFAFAHDYFNGPIIIEVPPIDKNFNYWNVGVGVKYNIASLYKSNTQIKSAELATNRATESNALVQEQLANDIETAIIHYKEAQKSYETQVKQVQLATENYNIIRNRYLNDFVLITEMLDAENSKIDAELQAVNAQINIVFQYYQLKKLSGTL